MIFHNLKRFLLLSGMTVAILGLSESSFATYPEGYYNSLNGKCGRELMTAVKKCVASHTTISYGTDTWNAFKDTDVKTIDGVDYWWDMYSNNLVKVSSGHPGMNIEHSVANSWWGKTKNDAYKDIVHLNPSDQDANSRKGNYPLAELQTVSWTNGVTSVGKAKSGQGGGASNCYEPTDEYKGDFARVFMYMFTIYEDISWKSNTAWMYDTSKSLMFQDWARDLLLRWNSADPVSQKEISRNDGIYRNQKNRNPFIDLPDLADHIWGSKSNVPFDLDNPGVPDQPSDPEDPEIPSDDYSWLSENDSEATGWSYENTSLPSGGTYVWSWKEYNGLHYLNASAYIGGQAKKSLAYAWSPEVDMTNVKSAVLGFSHAAKFQTTLRDLCKVSVKDVESGEITDVAITQWPSAGSWTFTDCKGIDLSDFANKKVRIGFKYQSTDSGADTWEIRNVNLNLTRLDTGIDLNTDNEDDSFLVEVRGNNILAPVGARIFDLNGREFEGTSLQRGVYVVVKPSFDKAVKVLIK